MKKATNKRLVIPVAMLLVLLVVYVAANPHINRLLDNRERATMSRQGLLIEQKIQAVAHQDKVYPSEERVKQLVQASGLISPHTHSRYEFTGGISSLNQVQDSQIAYGLGDYATKTTDPSKAYFCIGISLPRVHEGGASCESLNLDSKTDTLIKYELSCKINWLGFSTGCDKSILDM